MGDRGRLQVNLPSILSRNYNNREALKHLDKVSEDHHRVQEQIENLNAQSFTLQYRKWTGNSNVKFLARLAADDTESDVNTLSRITQDKDLDVFFLGASGRGSIVSDKPNLLRASRTLRLFSFRVDPTTQSGY